MDVVLAIVLDHTVITPIGVDLYLPHAVYFSRSNDAEAGLNMNAVYIQRYERWVHAGVRLHRCIAL